MLKILKNILSIIRYVITVLIVILVAIILVQRFSNNNISVAGYRIFTVVTESMVPKYNVGDVLLVKYKEPSKIKKEEDVTYQGKVGSFADKVVTHQVIDIQQDEAGNLKFVTKGIANDEKDPIVDGSQIYGVVQSKLGIVTKLNGIMNNTYGIYFLIIIPLAIIMFTEIRGAVEDAKAKKRGEDEENEEDGEEGKEKNEIENIEKNNKDSVIDKKAQKRKEKRNKRRKRYE